MNIFLAVPSLDGRVTWECSESILKASHYLRDSGHRVYPFGHARNIYLDRARNICVMNFLESVCDCMVFIDSDVGFDADALLKLVNRDKDVVAGVYPLKQDILEFPLVLYFDPKTNNCKEESTGLVTAEMVPTGMLKLTRSVFEKMDVHYNIPKDHEGVKEYFKTGIIFPDDPTWYGEDVAFCKRWLAIGGELFIEPNINFTHTGVKHYKGNLHEFLMGRVVQNYGEAEAGIPGWTTDAELRKLRELAAQSADVVEVGSWKGRSTKELLESCKGTVFAVDHWQGSPNDFSSVVAKGSDIYAEFIKNVGHYPNLRILKGSSVDMAEEFNGTRVDTVFIDAGHSYEECKADIDAWLPKCRKFICGHDYTSFPGVKKAVDDRFGDSVKSVQDIWYVQLKESEES